jgi:hypothetical protein
MPILRQRALSMHRETLPAMKAARAMLDARWDVACPRRAGAGAAFQIAGHLDQRQR